MCDGDVYNVINGNQTELLAMEMQLVRPNDLHYCLKSKSETHDMLNLEIDISFFETFAESMLPGIVMDLKNRPYIPKKMCSTYVFNHCNMLKDQLQRYYDVNESKEKTFILKQIFVVLLTEYLEEFAMETRENIRDNTFFVELFTLMNASENIGLRLHEVCDKYPCSVSYAIKKFKAEGKDTPNKIFREVKLNYACMLLKTTSYTVDMIGEIVGYGSMGFFSRLFVERFGVTPSEYRRIYRKGN